MAKEKMIKLARYRNYPYSVNFITADGMPRRYEWSSCKGDYVDIKEIPETIVQWLMASTTTFSDGELAIVEDDSKETKEILENMDEEYFNNTLSKERIVELLNGNTNTMKAEFKKINERQEISFICDVAKEIGLDSSSKKAFLAELMGVPQDILFSDDEE